MSSAVEKFIQDTENYEPLNKSQENEENQAERPFLELVDQTKKKSEFGELFITNDELEGGISCLQHFKGKLITDVTGGNKKLFVIEEEFEQGLISTLHAQEYDEMEYTFSEEGVTGKNLEEIFQSFSDRGRIRKLVCGKKHTLILAENGRIYSYGVGEYGVLGHGGVHIQYIPRPILKLAAHQIAQIACGDYHCLALTQNYDLYAWGRGFEGQLGIKQESSSVPMHVNHFYQGYKEKRGDQKTKLVYISCGSNHSMCLDENGQAYIWGEAKLGACGTGKKGKEPLPVVLNLDAHLEVPQQEGTVRITHNQIQKHAQNRIVKISGGFAHSACITENGDAFCWGFNVMGQLGLGDSKTRYYPQRLTKDILGNLLPRFTNIQCGYNSTFAIDENGGIWSWGSGNLGHKNDFKSDLPRKITDGTENRKFKDICAISNAATFFAPLRTMSVRPNYGPSTGGTLISLLGIGFADTSKQSLRFLFGGKMLEVALVFDPSTLSFNATTPNFTELIEQNSAWPMLCDLQVTLDGKIYSQCEQQFLIYSHKLVVSTINPKYASSKGGQTLELQISIDPLTASYLKHLTVGFQKRAKKDKAGRNDSKMLESNNNNNNNALLEKSQMDDKQINPLNLSLNDPELEKENYLCVEGNYESGKVICQIPALDEIAQDNLQYNVDIALNGQQFTGQPSTFRYYDIIIHKFYPDNDLPNGGVKCTITGEGFFDTLNKKVMLETDLGQRIRDVVWDKKDKTFQFIIPPASWLLGGMDETPQLLNKIYESSVNVSLTLNGIEWTEVGKFRYLDTQILRIGPAALDPSMSEHDRQIIWQKEEAEVNPFQGLELQAEIDKKQAELQTKVDEENNEMETLFKKAGSYLFIHGQNFIRSEHISVRYVFENKVQLGVAVYKNSKKLGVQIPELEDIPTGIQNVIIEVSFNGESFSNSRKHFRYLSFDKNATPQERQKFEDEELKKLKVPPKKAAKK